ncbi:hypothetical protein DIE11_17525 [Burkholderia sp. Bp9012]|uniref:hypothetical protein n=1 Tax=Burkholderia sp. Bp9012 TaxID=2184562 RepID=UPI000F5A4C4F|nr:hypothetical protein [Burkholderia sp. Bp9012]RQR79193.1 hypothetical protein DIE11_17525 [Burkholderia sp. Bp9012]
MSDLLEEDVLDAVVPLDKGMKPSHFQFFFTWRHAVELVGSHLFGDGTAQGVNDAVDPRDLRPNVGAIRNGFDALSEEQQQLAAVLVCFYDLAQGAALLQRAGVQHLMTITQMRRHLRRVIARLMLCAV